MTRLDRALSLLRKSLAWATANKKPAKAKRIGQAINDLTPRSHVDPYALTTHDGKKVDCLTDAALIECERRLGYSLTIEQGSYNAGGVSASAGTHDGGGVVDLAPYDWANKVHVLREVGFAAWHRTPIPGVWPEHIHAVLIGNKKLAPAAVRQVADYRHHLDGLASHAPDNSWHPDPIPVFHLPADYRPKEKP